MPHVPALVQVLVVFALVVAATARRVHLGLAALAGGLVFALWRGRAPLEAAGTAVAEFLDPDTLLLLLLVSAIMAFSSAMKKSGALADFSRAVDAIAPSPRAAMIAAPLLIGTLPMPGGAILSAPLVDALDPGRHLGAARLSAANYWFRHSLELAWPLYPAFILTSSLSGFPASKLSGLNLYATPVLILLGYLFVLRLPAAKAVGSAAEAGGVDGPGGALPPAARPAQSATPSSGRWAAIVHGFMPLALILGTFALLDAIWRLLAPGFDLDGRSKALAGRYLPILGGMAVGFIHLALRTRSREAFRDSVNFSSLKLALVIAGIRVFSALLESGGAASASAAELAAAGIPALAAAAVLPFVAGLVTGVGFGYVGLSFPIVLGLFPAGGAVPLEAAIVLSGAFGYAGMMLSPLHVCMVVSAEHFGTGLAPTIRHLALPLALFLVVACAYAFGLARVLG